MDTKITVGNVESAETRQYDHSKVLGLDIQFSKMLGDVIVENYIKQLSEDDMQLVIDYITQDLFEMRKVFSSDDPEAKKKYVRESWTTRDDSFGFGRYSSDTVTSTGDVIKKMFNERFKKEMENRIVEIIKSDEYQKKVDDIAHDIVDYVVDGYKKDLMQSIRQKLIGNIISNEQSYGSYTFEQAVHHIVEEYFPRNGAY